MAGGMDVIRIHSAVASSIIISLAVLILSCSKQPQPGTVLDEAKLAGRTAASFPHAADDYFHDMDAVPRSTTDEVIGRNVWLVWTGGNDRFWNTMAGYTFGAFDLLKSISSHPSLGFSRANRWNYLGLVNEPCFETPAAPDPNRRGLWLDVRRKDCPADPFEDETRYPGVALGSRGKPLSDGTTQPVGSFYGYATGIMGLRLFPNPDFDAKAAKDWNPERYYNRSVVLQPGGSGAAVPRRHVLWFLSRRSQPRPSARGSECPNLCRSEFLGGRAIHVGGPAVHLQFEQGRGPEEFHVPAREDLSAGFDGHVADLHGQHQQPAHDERRVRLRLAHGAREKLVAREARRRGTQ